MKKIIVLSFLFISSSIFSQTLFKKEATQGTQGGDLTISKAKKGYVLSAQKTTYDYVVDKAYLNFKKEKHLITFLTNVINVYSWRNELSKEDFPDGYMWQGPGYNLVYDFNGDYYSIRIADAYELNTDIDAIVSLNKSDIEEISNLLKKLSK